MKGLTSYPVLRIWTFLSLFLTLSSAGAQSVGLGTQTPHASAIFDITSTDKGMLVPRMTTAQRTAIASPANGLLVFDVTTGSFWFYNNMTWNNLVGGGGSGSMISDADNDTKVQVEEAPDEDVIRFDVAGEELMVIRHGTYFSTMIEPKGFGGNVFFGEGNGLTNSGLNNTGIGASAMADVTFGEGNTALGASALGNTTTGSYNTALGHLALGYNTAGDENLAIGTTSLLYNKANRRSLAIGIGAMQNADDRTNGRETYNTAVGYESLMGGANPSQNIGTANTAMGYYSLRANQNGSANVAIGTVAMEDNIGGTNNTAIGNASLNSNTYGYQNVAIGKSALEYNTTGNNNVAIGWNALLNNTLGFTNTAVGARAMNSNRANNRSTAVGYGVMFYADDRLTGRETFNTAIGYEALRGSLTPANNTGQYNTAIGDQALLANTGGSQNTATGVNALQDNTSGSSNTATGYQALNANTTGMSNTALGFNALLQNTTGDNNTAIGRSAFFLNALLDNTTCIGYGSGGISNVSNRIEIGNTSVSWIGGQVNWSTYSDARIKKNVQENVPGLDFITRLRPVTYNLDIHAQNAMTICGKKEEADWPEKYDIEQKTMTGFIAQEVEAAAQAAGYDFSGVEKAADAVGMYSVRYAEFVVPLVKAVQEQQAIIAQLENRLAQAEARQAASLPVQQSPSDSDELHDMIADLRHRLEAVESANAALAGIHRQLNALTEQVASLRAE